MTAQTEEFLRQSPEDFLNQAPEDFLNPEQFLNGIDPAEQITQEERKRTLLWIAVAIAAAIYAHHRLTVARLRDETVDSERQLLESMRKVWPKVMPAWQKMVIPAVMHSFKLGSTSSLTYEELETLASAYAQQMGDYVTSTSAEAVVEGFNAQLNAGWNPQVAAIRAKEAYGLDSKSMRQAVSSFTKGDPTYSGDVIPASVRTLIDKLIIRRGELVGSSEAYAAVQMAKALTWQFAYKSGDMQPDAQKMWITAKDERVCPICGPMDKQTVAPDEYFVSGEDKYFAPGVHPRCRCRVQLVYSTQFQKAMPGDPYDRDKQGQFARSEQRKRQVRVDVREREVNVEAEQALSGLRERMQAARTALAEEIETAIAERTLAPLSTMIPEKTRLKPLPTSKLTPTVTLTPLESILHTPPQAKLSTRLSQTLSTSVEALSDASLKAAAVAIIVRRSPSTETPNPTTLRPDFEEQSEDIWVFYDDYIVMARKHGIMMSASPQPGEIIDFQSMKESLDRSFDDLPEEIRPPIIGYRSQFDADAEIDFGLHEALIESKNIAKARYLEGQNAREMQEKSGDALNYAYAYARNAFEERLWDLVLEDEQLTDADIKAFYGDIAPKKTGQALREQFYLDMRKSGETAEQLMESYKLHIASNPDHLRHVLDVDADLLTHAALSDWLIPMTMDYQDYDSSVTDDGSFMPTVLRVRSAEARTGKFLEDYVTMHRPATPEELDPSANYEVTSVEIVDIPGDSELSVYLQENIYKYRVVTVVPR